MRQGSHEDTGRTRVVGIRNEGRAPAIKERGKGAA